MNFVHLPRDIWLHRVLQFLTLAELVRTDSAVNNKANRSTFLENIRGCNQYFGFTWKTVHISEQNWRCLRGILPTYFLAVPDICSKYVDIIASQTIDITFIDCEFRTGDELLRIVQPCCNTLEYVTFKSCKLPSTWSLKNCKVISELDISHCPTITDDNLENIVPELPLLRRITVFECTNLTARGFGALLENCKSVRMLSVCSTCDLNDVLDAITVPVALTELTWDHAKSVSLRRLPAVLPHLTLLSLDGHNNASDADIDVLVRGCPHITSLALSHFQRITDTALFVIASLRPGLTHFTLIGAPRVTDAGVMVLVKKCALLTSLDLESLSITNTAIQAAGTHCRLLRFLYVPYCSSLTDSAFDTLSAAALIRLDVSGTSVTGTFATRFFRIPDSFKRRSLTCNDCALLSPHVFAQALVQCSALFRLSLNHGVFTQNEWLTFSQHTLPVRYLWLIGSEHVDEEVVRSFIQHNSALETLMVRGCEKVPAALAKEFKCVRISSG